MKKILVLASVLLLASCGGSSGNSQPGAPDTQTPTIPVVPPPVPPVVPPPVEPEKLLAGTVFGVSPASDVPVGEAHFNYPEDTIEAPGGVLYITDTHSHVIRQIKDGVVSVFAGTFAAGYNGDGQKLKTVLNLPTALQLSPDGKFLLFADSGNNLLRKIDLTTGVLTTFAGKQGDDSMPSDNAVALGSPIGYVASLKWDDKGNLWFPVSHRTASLDEGGLFYIDRTGVIHQKPVNGVGAFVSVRDIDIGAGYIDFMRYDDFYRVFENGIVKQRKLPNSYGKGIVTVGSSTLIGNHTSLFSLDADLNLTLAASGFANLSNVKKAERGYLLTDSDQGVVHRYENGVKTQLSGTAASSYGALVSVVKYTDTSVLILDNQRPRIYLLDLTTGRSSLWAGTGDQGWASIGVDKLKSTFYYPNGIAVDAAKNVYVVEQHRILKIDPAGQVNVLAGYDFAGDVDGTYNAARFYSPGSIAVDGAGNVIVADTYNNKVRKVSPGGVVTTIAGTGVVGMPSYGVAGQNSALNHPLAVAVLPDGAILIADGWNNSVHKLGADGILRPFAGKPNQTGYQGTGTFSGDGGAAINAGLNTPAGLAVRGGTVYISDEFNQRVREVRPDGVITTFAGSVQGFLPEGKLLSFPREMVVLGDQLLVADTGNRNIVRYYLP
jgi:sugar lactone lactonase YvrE